jgi:chromosome segregation ATPase
VADTYTIEEAYVHLQEIATNAGRCPHCGRRRSDDEAKLFDDLRDQAAKANDRADKLEAKLSGLKDENDSLKVRNADLRASNAELRQGQ